MRIAIVTHDEFNPSLSNAYQATRLGYLNGFRLLGMESDFVRHGEIDDIDPDGQTVFWLTAYDYQSHKIGGWRVPYLHVAGWYDREKTVAPSPGEWRKHFTPVESRWMEQYLEGKVDG